MTGAQETDRRGLREWANPAWLSGGDDRADVVFVVGVFGFFFVLQRLTSQVADIGFDDVSDFVLLGAAVRANPLSAAGVVALLAAVFLRGRRRVWSPWASLQHGEILRLVVAPPLVLIAWRLSTNDYNYVAGQWHIVDRVLLVLLVIGALARPVFLVLVALQARVLLEQFDLVSGLGSSQAMTNLLVIVVMAAAATFLLYVVTGHRRTAPFFLLVSAAVAAHFFSPGWGKLRLGWWRSDDVSNFAQAGYTAGWRGGGDGTWADTVADFAATYAVPMRLATMLIELGAAVAVLHYRALRLWLPLAVGFHVATFVFTGFWFAEWIVVELVLFALLMQRSLAAWFQENVKPWRMALAFASVVVFASVLFDAPRLAWFDADVSYGYEVDAVVDDGRRVAVPLDAFAPFTQDLAFSELAFDGVAPAASGYGAVFSADRRDDLRAIRTIDELLAYEASLDPVSPEAQMIAQNFVLTFVDYANTDPLRPLSWATPPSHFWTSRAGAEFEFGDQIVELEVTRVRSVHSDESASSKALFRREVVLRVALDATGRAMVVDDAT